MGKWSKTKALGMIAWSFCINLLSLGLYIFDVHTDKKFVDEMFENSVTNFDDRQRICSSNFFDEIEDGNQFCHRETRNISTCFSFYEDAALTARRCRQIG